MKDYITQTIIGLLEKMREIEESKKHDDGIGWSDEIGGYNKAKQDTISYLDQQIKLLKDI